MTMVTVASVRERRPGVAGGRVLVALTRAALRDSRVRTISFFFLFAVVCYVQPVAYRHTYPTLAERIGFARSFAHNKAVVLFYGKAYDLLSVSGYTAWRAGGTLAIFATAFGMLAAVRAMRTDEEAGRTELVLAAPVGRGTGYVASLISIAIATMLLGAAAFAGLVIGGLPAGGSAYLALSVITVVPVTAGIGALVSQLAASKRLALELGSGAVGLFFILRVIADTSGSASWLRWLTPLGWAEELRPFTGARPLVLLVPAAAGAITLTAAWRIAAKRDIGRGLLALSDSAPSRLWLLSSPTAQTLREERGGLLVWATAVGALALVMGVVSKSVSSVGVSPQLRHALERLGAGSALTPKAYLGFGSTFFVVVVSVLAISQIAAARHEEAEERLEPLLALPIGRTRWFGGRVALATIAIVMLSLITGLLMWLGAVSQGVSISLPLLLEAGINCMPVALLFLGIAALLYAAIPRASAALSYGLLTVLYLWQLFGSLLGAPKWLVDATPFAHIGVVPVQPFRVGAAFLMVGIGTLTAILGATIFRRRDLIGA